jgi:hypothetical protein
MKIYNGFLNPVVIWLLSIMINFISTLIIASMHVNDEGLVSAILAISFILTVFITFIFIFYLLSH